MDYKCKKEYSLSVFSKNIIKYLLIIFQLYLQYQLLINKNNYKYQF